MPVPKHNPLETYDPRFRDLLIKGSREVVEIPLDTQNKAYRLRLQLERFRHRVREYFGDSQPDMWKPLYSCFITYKDEGFIDGTRRKKPSTTVVLKPRDQEFGNALDIALSESPTAAPAPLRLSDDPLAEFKPEKE